MSKDTEPIKEPLCDFIARFRREIPRGTVVWREPKKTTYGTTTYGAVYDNKPEIDTVWVVDIDGRFGTADLWDARVVSRKNEASL